MAIEKQLIPNENELKINIEKAYIKIVDVEMRISNGTARIKVIFFANKESRNSNGLSILKKEEIIKISDLKPFMKDFSVDGFKTAAYNYLKTLQFYQGVDC